MTLLSPAEAKRCCADLYASDWLRFLLGDSLHPGGLALTEQIGATLGLLPSTRVLDVATGAGTSARAIAQRFGCQVVGLDYSARNFRPAESRTQPARVGGRVRCICGDAEHLPFASASFDAVLCECAFSTFADKALVATELRRVLVPGGRLGFSDVTRHRDLPPELQGPVAAMACIADARSPADYAAYLEAGGFAIDAIAPHDDALEQLVHGVRGKLVGAELLTKLGKLADPGIDFITAKSMARRAVEEVRAGNLGYTVILATASAQAGPNATVS